MAKIEKFEGDMFWNADDTENSVLDPDDELDNICERGAVVRFQQAKTLADFFGVDCGPDDNGIGVYEYFSTLEEAESRSSAVKAAEPSQPEGMERSK